MICFIQRLPSFPTRGQRTGPAPARDGTRPGVPAAVAQSHLHLLVPAAPVWSASSTWSTLKLPGLLAGRELLECLDELPDDRLGGNEHPELVGRPSGTYICGFAVEPLERVLPQVDHERHVGLEELACCDISLHDLEADLPVVDAEGVEVGVVVEVEDLAARGLSPAWPLKNGMKL